METGWFHDLILFLTALAAAYAAYRTSKTGVVVEKVRQQTDGLAKALAVESRASGHTEGLAEGRAEERPTLPPGVFRPPSGP